MVKRILAAVVSVMLIIFILSLGACSQATAPSPPVTPLPSQNTSTNPINPTWTPPQVIQQPALPAISQVVSKVKPSVVAINVEVVTYNIFNQPTKMEGAGSGWIIDKDGYIVTNNHVVEGADSVMVTLEDGSKFSATDVKTDSLTDLAVVKIDAHNLPVLGIGDSSTLEIGDWLVAVGNALGMGYAISINEATPVIEKLITVGYVVRPWLGVGLATVNQTVASWYNLAVDAGALVTDVASGSPAEEAGLKAGDVITAIDGKEVASAGDLMQLINSYQIGQKVEITFWRGQTKNSASLTLGESPPPQS